MIQWGPDTDNSSAAQSVAGGYFYPSDTIEGFSLTHLSGAGCQAFGDIPFMPYPNTVQTSPMSAPSTYSSRFSHTEEIAHPGYYAVKMDDGYVERPGLSGYLADGYVPSETPSLGPDTGSTTPDAASVTLEYAADDFAISAMAATLRKKAVASKYLERSGNWRNVFDPATGMAAPRQQNGEFPPGWPAGSKTLANTLESLGFGGLGQMGFQEGDAYQYTWMVPQDLAGLFSVMGGRAKATDELETFFTELNAGAVSKYDWAGNETTLEIPWEGDYSGAPWLTQRTVHRILDSLYTDSPSGVPGNDDLGAMSSWAVWAMLGLYPETPGTTVLDVSSPVFDSERVHLADGKDISVTASRRVRGATYISAATLDGKSTQRTWLPLTAVSDGASLHLTLVGAPDKKWGSAPSDAPPSYPAKGNGPTTGDGATTGHR